MTVASLEVCLVYLTNLAPKQRMLLPHVERITMLCNGTPIFEISYMILQTGSVMSLVL